MRKPSTIEHLYLDFDGFFASVMQQVDPKLRDKPIGIIPFETDKAHSTTVIACSKEAKRCGVKNVMRVSDVLKICPQIILVPQRPDLYRRAHNALLNEIACEIPIDVIKSIDEIACRLGAADISNPHDLSHRIKTRIANNIGPYITCSIGFAGNRMLAKMACKMDKPNGTTIWHPRDMPAPIIDLDFDDVPGIGRQMQKRLWKAGIGDMQTLIATQPKHLRALWKSVAGERMWYALHGYDIHAMPTERNMFGHGRILPPDSRTLAKAAECSRMLLIKAARRMRREGFYARYLSLWLHLGKSRGWSSSITLGSVNDDHSITGALRLLWQQAKSQLRPRSYILQVHVALGDLTSANTRQLDLLKNDDAECQRWEKLTFTIDNLNQKFGKRVVSLGPWSPSGQFAGGKIAFTRIPDAEDFY